MAVLNQSAEKMRQIRDQSKVSMGEKFWLSKMAPLSSNEESSEDNEPLIRIRTTRARNEVWEHSKEKGALSRHGVTYGRAHANGHGRKSVLGTRNVFFTEMNKGGAGGIFMQQMENSEIASTTEDDEEEETTKQWGSNPVEVVDLSDSETDADMEQEEREVSPVITDRRLDKELDTDMGEGMLSEEQWGKGVVQVETTEDEAEEEIMTEGARRRAEREAQDGVKEYRGNQDMEDAEEEGVAADVAEGLEAAKAMA